MTIMGWIIMLLESILAGLTGFLIGRSVGHSDGYDEALNDITVNIFKRFPKTEKEAKEKAEKEKADDGAS